MTPVRLYNIALGQGGGSGQRAGEHAGGTGYGGGTGRGFGQMTLSQYCKQAGLDIDSAIEKLNK